MVIFYKCSFRSSHGFRIVKYQTNSEEMTYINEKIGDMSGILPETIAYTLSNQLGRCLLLAVDENGNYFFGVYRLVEGNDDKYVNAVFHAPESPETIIHIYEYFCTHQKTASQMLLDSIRRAEPDEENYQDSGFAVVPEVVRELLKSIPEENSGNISGKLAPNSIIAFITENEYEDYQVTLENQFSVNPNKMFLCEKYHPQEEVVHNYQLAMRVSSGNFLPVPRQAVIGGIVAVIVLIIIILFPK